jgi:NAD+ kinase
MSPRAFDHILLFVCKKTPVISRAFAIVSEQLRTWGCMVTLHEKTLALFPQSSLPVANTHHWAERSLIVVIGGDGSMLQAAPLASQYNIPILGINGGRTGFLTDIHAAMPHALEQVIMGRYKAETRLMLNCRTIQHHQVTDHGNALNEVALLQGEMLKILDFDLYINEQCVSTQRADGLVVATPTGSTAYALSAGGPIVEPSLAVISIVPICAHTLNSRPIIIEPGNTVRIRLHTNNYASPSICLDGQSKHYMQVDEVMEISRAKQSLTIIHPIDYHYFHTLKNKLHWEKKPDAANTTD